MDENVMGIYKIENTKNHKVYIGSSKNMYTRLYQHEKMLKKGIHHSIKLQRSYDKEEDKTIFEFSIIETIDDKDKLADREQYYIDLYNSYYDGYNCTKKAINTQYKKKTYNKRQKKKVKAEELKELYNEFWDIYNSSFCEFGSEFLNRLKSNHYKNATMIYIIKTIRWFKENFDPDKYFFYFRFFYGHYGKENPHISVHRIADRYDMGTYQIIKGKMIKIYEGDN
jgi:group I intron endonuclease